MAMQLPLDLVACDNGLDAKLGCPKPRWAIGFFFPKTDTEEACLKLVHLEADATLIPRSEPPNFIMHN
ncbi:hypothetical protein U9M48_019748 [Paspalum notatum var. saurae]|uniref:Uncharacterized protein n=1 Tax=Paspalum notatum var. saurae TaxID=547442 RepID=A0AAQ3WR01_PASNO